MSSWARRCCSTARRGSKPCGLPLSSQRPGPCRPSERSAAPTCTPSSHEAGSTPRAGPGAGALADIESGALARFQVAAGHQPVVGLDHGERRNALLARQGADRGQAHAGPEHLSVDADPGPLDARLDQGLFRSYAVPWHAINLVTVSTDTVASVSVLYRTSSIASLPGRRRGSVATR